uniref:Uncharacterized protein n=1 Tax=Anopheles stephensi TaxID=30069 RepID=A0A182XV97_ANOST
MKLWLIPLLYLGTSLAIRNERLVVDVVNWQQLKVVYIFHCFHQQHEFIHLVHSVRRNCPNSMAFVNVASFRERNFVTSLGSVHVRVGLMADLNCRDMNSIGSWSVSTGLMVWNNRSSYERRLILSGMQLSGISKSTEDEFFLTLVQTQLARTGNVYYDVEEGFSLMEQGRSAFVCDAYRAYQQIQHHFTDEQRCALQEIPLTGKKPKHLALAKDHPLEEQFRVTVQKIIGTSIVQYERSLCYADKPRCAENEVKMPEVNLDQVSSVLTLLISTIVGSVAILLLEITVSKVLPGRH